MAIVFGFDDDDLEPLEWVEAIEFADGAMWVPEGLTEVIVFFDSALLDSWDPAEDIKALLMSLSEGARVTLERWGYLASGDENTRQSIAKLERHRNASPLLRYHYGTGSLFVAVISVPRALIHSIRRKLKSSPACVDILKLNTTAQALEVLQPNHLVSTARTAN